ncbi:MAG: hypothetical protein GY903_22650 [Fuerstiella sp.]|nr:hypothetical protein [Fuerstiella sp.]MCP4857292.1 hypothetical protein [Fuerstiella sp.]
MFPIDVFRDTVCKLVEILHQHRIPFHLTGGITSIAFGEPRLTQDVDIVIDNAAVADRLKEFLVSLQESDFQYSGESIRGAVARRKMFQLLDTVETLKLDIYPRELIPGELGRSVTIEVFEGLRLPIVSHVDAVVSKLAWISRGSHKSRRDVRQLWRVADVQQQHAIQELAAGLELSGLLVEVLAEPDEIIE